MAGTGRRLTQLGIAVALALIVSVSFVLIRWAFDGLAGAIASRHFQRPAASPEAEDPRNLAAVEAANACDFTGALAALDALSPARREEPMVRFFRARMLVQLGRGHEAVAELDALQKGATAISQGQIELLRGFALSLDRQPEAADAALARSAQEGADRDLVDEARGVVLARAGDTQRAESLLRDVLARSPTLSGALYNLGCVLALQGRLPESASLIHQAWQAGQRDPHQLREDPELVALRKAGLIDDLRHSSEHSCETY